MHPPAGKLKFLEKVIAILLAIIIITMFSQVVFRYLLNQSLYWSEEIVRYLFIWLVFLGGALVTRDDGHIGIDYLLTIIPSKHRNLLRIFGSIVVILVSIFFSIGGIILVFRLKGSLSPALGLPVNWFLYAALPAASLFSTWYGYKNFIKLRNSISSPSPEVEPS